VLSDTNSNNFTVKTDTWHLPHPEKAKVGVTNTQFPKFIEMQKVFSW